MLHILQSLLKLFLDSAPTAAERHFVQKRRAPLLPFACESAEKELHGLHLASSLMPGTARKCPQLTHYGRLNPLDVAKVDVQF